MLFSYLLKVFRFASEEILLCSEEFILHIQGCWTIRFLIARNVFCYILVCSDSRFNFVRRRHTTLWPMISWFCVISLANSDFLLLFVALVHFVSVLALKSLTPLPFFICPVCQAGDRLVQLEKKVQALEQEKWRLNRRSPWRRRRVH